ncbi:MAG: class I SAM-dependent methyltransferase [Chloroflexota bacterium]
MTDETVVTPEEIQACAQTVGGYITGHFVSLMINLGDRLGLYKALAHSGSHTAASLAQQTGLSERWLLEWLSSQTAAGLIEHEHGAFTLAKAAVPILVDETSPLNLNGIFTYFVPEDDMARVAKAFETGIGVSYDQHGPNCACSVKRLTGPGHSQLVEHLQLIDGLHEKLEQGAAVVDVGCGAGVALRELARHYPNSTFEGYDPAEAAIELARSDAAQDGLTNITFHAAPGEDLPQQPRYDLVLTLDCLHDMPFPQQVMDAIRGCIKSDGVWVIKDIRCSDQFDENLANPSSTMLYSISVLVCMSSALSEAGGAGLGTMGFNPVLGQQMAQASGFSSFIQLPIDSDPFNNYYEVTV